VCTPVAVCVDKILSTVLAVPTRPPEDSPGTVAPEEEDDLHAAAFTRVVVSGGGPNEGSGNGSALGAASTARRTNGSKRDTTNAQLLMACTLELAMLTTQLKAYRELLPPRTKQTFDETWGLDSHTGDLLSGHRRKGLFGFMVDKVIGTNSTNVAKNVLEELMKIRQSVDAETKNFELRALTDNEKVCLSGGVIRRGVGVGMTICLL
jgi:hypothetical protein